ncbi:BTAD domain-containing putative transcriptional regulator [Actinosynnema sp. NPDC004786]
MGDNSGHGGSRDVLVGVLGEVEVRLNGVPVPLGHARQRSVLGALLVDRNRPVPADTLVDRVWGGRTPGRARAALRTYLSNLRRALAPTPITITRRDTGYVVTVDPDTVDVDRFARLHARARDTDDPEQALALVERALALWRGEPLAESDTPWARSVRERLRLDRAAAEADRVDWALACGRHRDLIPALTARAAEDPLDERVTARLMLALYREGRQADALEHYRRLRTSLARELGVDPGAELQRLHQRILTTEPVAAPGDTRTPVPRQLPAAPAPFVGRLDELDRLDTALKVADHAATVLISAIGGAGGIGKTWLALHWAHAHRDRFPDGQLFADLNGFGPTGDRVTPAAVLRNFLDALGVDPRRRPADPDAQAALFRSLVAGRRVLLVLDNAADTDQVTPLLPGSETCTVLVTSRNHLPGLISGHGAHHLALDVLPIADARALLTARLGVDRVESEAKAVDDLIKLSGGFPLALSVVAAHAHTRPRLPLAVLAAELRDLGLDALDTGDPTASLPAVLSWSVRALPDDRREVFALLGIAPGADTDLFAAAALTGLPVPDTRRALLALEDASLLHRDAQGRYGMHELIRAYAADTARDLPDPTRHAALTRVVDFYLHTAAAADRLLEPDRQPVALPPPSVPARPPADLPEAMAWLDAEHANVLAAQQVAAAQGRRDVVWQLAWTLYTFHYRRGHTHENLALWQAALAASLPDPPALVHRHLGVSHAYLGHHDRATDHLHRALAVAERQGDPTEQANTHRQLAWTWERRGDDRRAMAHARAALDLYRALDQTVGEVRALNQVGWYAVRLGDYDTAREHCLAALTANRRHHSTASEADIHHSLGWIEHHAGRHRQAVGHYERALALFRDLGDAVGVAGTLDHLAEPHAALGHTDRARAAWQEALELYRDQGRAADVDRVRRRLGDLGTT